MIRLAAAMKGDLAAASRQEIEREWHIFRIKVIRLPMWLLAKSRFRPGR
jgi:hypothetical protein